MTPGLGRVAPLFAPAPHPAAPRRALNGPGTIRPQWPHANQFVEESLISMAYCGRARRMASSQRGMPRQAGRADTLIDDEPDTVIRYSEQAMHTDSALTHSLPHPPPTLSTPVPTPCSPPTSPHSPHFYVVGHGGR